MKNKLRLFAASLVVLFAVGLSSQSQAASPTVKGVTISPAFQQVIINQDEAEHAVTFRITNNEAAARTYNLSAADFNTLGESGGLFFVGTNPTELQKKYGLAKWFSLPQKTITVQPGQTFTLKAKIENLPDLSPGGHYGALMLSQDESQADKQSRVAIHPIASSLMFVTKLGGDTHTLNLDGVSLKRSIFSLPSNITLRFQNTGNSHVVPRGAVTITGSGGKVISKGIINSDSNIVLPQTIRRFYVPLQAVSKSYSAGSYKLAVDFRFDGYAQYRRYQQTFIYIPLAILLLSIAVVLVSGLVVFRLLRRKRRS